MVVVEVLVLGFELELEVPGRGAEEEGGRV